MATFAPAPPTDAANLTSIRPPGTMTNDELIVFVRSRAYHSSPLYGADFSRFRKSELYDQSDQWLQRAHGTRDSQYPAQWKRIEYASNDPNAVPLPVYNEGVLLRENESARLGRPEYKPRVRPSGTNPDITAKEGAKGAERALQDRLEAMWSDEEDKLYLHMPMYGGAWLKSYWHQTWLETVRVPAPSMCCPRHPKSGVPPPPLPPSMVEEPLSPLPGVQEIPAEPPTDPSAPPTCDYCEKKEGMGMGMGMGMGDSTASPTSTPPTCPHCPDSPALVPYSPTLDEALNSPDLGIDMPKGDWFLKVLYPYQIFVRDAGVGVDPTDIDEWVEVRTELLSVIESQWPDKIRDPQNGELRVHPQNAATLMAENPTLGSPDILQYAQHAGVFKSHVVVYEYNRKPWLEWDPQQKKYMKNRGRTVVAVVGAGGNGVVCKDADFTIESLNAPGTYVPAVHLQFIPWEKRDGGRRATVGQSLWDRLFDVQDGINERMSQVRAVNQRGALPWYLQRRGINLETRAADSAVPFRRVLADIDPTDRQLPLTLLNNETINPGVYEEVQYYTSFMGKHVVEVEKGQVPPGVAAATAIAYLKTESGEKRRPRILRIRRALTRSWNHGLQLMAALYIEDRPYNYKDEDDNEDRSAFINGNVIAQSNPKVDIYPTPDYDQTDARRESIRDQVQLGILNPSQTPQLGRKISAAMDESLEFFLDDDLQEQQAQREWRDFKEKGKVPVVDPSLDDDLTHYQEHGRSAFSEWFREREIEAQWDEALAVIGGEWDAGLERIKMMLVNPLPPPPGTPPGMAPPPLPSIQKLIERQWTMVIQQAAMQAQQAAMAAAQAPPVPGAPPPPPSPAPFTPNPVLLSVVIPWRAHMEAHKLKVEINQMKEQMRMAATAPKPGMGSAPTSAAEAEVDSGTPGGTPTPSPAALPPIA